MIDLMLVTDRHAIGERDLRPIVGAALRGGVDVVQLREKDMATRDLLELASDLREITQQAKAKLLINDRIDIALAVGADGVHLPTNSFAIEDARRLLGPTKLIGVSTHSGDQAIEAEQRGADYVVFGPVFATPSKLQYGPPVGLDALRETSEAVSVPLLAIGGIDADGSAQARAAGARGVAVIRAILCDDDPKNAASRLLAP